MESNKTKFLWGILRLALGWVFFWAFIDKVFGLGFTTCRDVKTAVVDVMCKSAWLEGGSPTLGFLKFATKGPFAEFYQFFAGAAWLDWLFMISLLGIGTALLLGIFVRPAAIAGAIWYFLMYTAGFIPPEHNPFLDEHLLNAVLLLALAGTHAGRWLGLGRWWADTSFVKRYPILE